MHRDIFLQVTVIGKFSVSGQCANRLSTYALTQFSQRSKHRGKWLGSNPNRMARVGSTASDIKVLKSDRGYDTAANVMSCSARGQSCSIIHRSSSMGVHVPR